jgi:hypothetical protein
MVDRSWDLLWDGICKEAGPNQCPSPTENKVQKQVLECMRVGGDREFTDLSKQNGLRLNAQ